jgi:pyruvate kinase
MATDMPVLIENDYVQLDGIQDNEVDFVALSFVRDKSDILILRKELEKRNLTANIVAKIENQEALNNIDEIIEASDAVMIARGDLAIEVPFEKLVRYQRMIIQKCREQAKPVITATHMLETMTDNPFPTRAEISDVAHAAYDLTDAVMLSGETTIGKYPIKTVGVQAKIVAYNEKYTESDYLECITENGASNIVNAVSSIAIKGFFDVDFMICLTETGRTPTLISRNRPKVPVHAIVSSKEIYDKLAVNYGIIPHLVDWPKEEKLINAEEVMKKIKAYHWFKPGTKGLIIHGPKWGIPGETNTVSIVTAK